MSEYSISCVLLIPAAHREAINTLAESLGYGPENLSVPLIDASGSTWFGCHTWCMQVFIDQLADPMYAGGEARSALIVSAIDGGDPASNWAQALADNGLSAVSEGQSI